MTRQSRNNDIFEVGPTQHSDLQVHHPKGRYTSPERTWKLYTTCNKQVLHGMGCDHARIVIHNQVLKRFLNARAKQVQVLTGHTVPVVQVPH